MAIFIQPGKVTQDRRTILSADAAGDYGTTILGTAGIAAAAEIAIDSFFNHVIALAASDETTDLTVGDGKVTFRVPFGLTLSSVKASVTTAPVGATIIVDIRKNGTTIFSTKVSIDAGEETSETAAVPSVISDNTLAGDDEIIVDVDQVGSSTAGAGLKIYLICIKE